MMLRLSSIWFSKVKAERIEDNSSLLKIFFPIAIFFVGCATSAQTRFEYEDQQMGTQIRLVFYASDRITADSVSKAVFSRIDELNTRLSDYLEDSELNKLCRRPKQAVKVSGDLFKALFKSVEISKKSGGAYDITAGPIIRLWRDARKSKILPKSKEIRKALNVVDYRNITFLGKDEVRLEKENMQLDLGGIGKGFAADEVLKVLAAHGINSALVDMGGDITVGNPPPDKEYWTLAFYYYNKEGKEIAQKIKLKNQAIATSGDLYQFLEVDGIRYSHIVDPKTGMALNSRIQVTVIALNGTMADGYASAFSVMGISKTKEKIDQIKGLNAFIVEQEPNKHLQWNSDGFHKFFLKN